LCNYYNLPIKIYNSILHLIHWKTLFKSDLIKTNQTNGSEIASKAAEFWKKPIIGRMGYLFSDDRMFNKGEGSFSHNYALKIENSLINKADRIVVTSDEIKKRLRYIHKINTKISITTIPNYVDCKLFAPDENIIQKNFDLIFIGRIEKVKNIETLLNAIMTLGVRSLIIGDGSLKTSLEEKFNSSLITWIGKIKNLELPRYLNRAQLYIIPSFKEGHPKTLIEAMSCGSAVIGANSPGISNIIDDGVNGILCEPNKDSMVEKISYLLENPKIRFSIGAKAREYAINRFSLTKISKLEYDLYSRILNKS